MGLRRTLPVFALALIPLVTSGCALYQYRIYPDYSLLEKPSSKAAPLSVKPAPEFHDVWQRSWSSLERAVAMGRKLESDYEGAHRVHERSGPVVYSVLLPLVAATAGLAITGTTGAPIAALALAGGATYAYGYGLTSTVRERIYAQGKTATRCLIDVYDGLLLSEDEYANFRARLDSGALLTARANVEQALDRVKRAIQKDLLRNGPDIQGIVKLAEDLEKDLVNLHTKGVETDALFREGGRRLRVQFGALAAAVNAALEKTELDMAALKAALMSSFSAMGINVTGAFSTALKAQDVAKTGSEAAKSMKGVTIEDEGQQALEELQTAMSDAGKVVEPMHLVLARLGDNPNQAAKICVDAAIAAIQVEPLKLGGNLKPTLTAGGSAVVTVTGGVRPYLVTVDGESATALDYTLDESQTAVATLTIKAKSDAKPGAYVVELTDHTSSSNRAIPVTVKTVQPGPAVKVSADQTTVKQGGRVVLHVSGGTPMYTVDVTPQPSPFGAPTTDSKEGSTVITLPVKADATPAKYTLTVKDASKTAAKEIEITIGK